MKNPAISAFDVRKIVFLLHLFPALTQLRMRALLPPSVGLALALSFMTIGGFMTFDVQAADEVVTFEDPAHKQLYQGLLKEYRCLKCQNQNLWDSNASLAGDLRREIREQILAGKSKADIDEFLVSRYGEFVLYRPRFTAKTAILWIGPFVLLLVGLTSVFFMVRGKSKGAADDQAEKRVAAMQLHSEDKLAKARDLLKDCSEIRPGDTASS